MSFFLIGCIALAVALVAALLFFAYRQMKPLAGEEFPSIEIHFDMNRKQALAIREILEVYIERNGAADALFYPGLTIAGLLHKLETDYRLYLDNEAYPHPNSSLRHADIESTRKRMEAAFRSLLQLKREIELKLH